MNFNMGGRRGDSKSRLLRHFSVPSRPKEGEKGHQVDDQLSTAWIIHELVHCVNEQSQAQHRRMCPEEDELLHAALSVDELLEGELCRCASGRGEVARVVALLLNRIFVRSNAFGLDSDVDSFNSLNRFIDRRLAPLVAILSPCAADPAISSSLNSLANGATDFTCKAWVRASIALPLISRFAQALMRCALEAGRSGIYWDLHEALLEAACGCLRNAFKSLDDALRIVANAPNGPSHLNRWDVRKAFKETSVLFGQLSDQALMTSAGNLHKSALLLAALQLECSPIILEASSKWISATLLLLLKNNGWVAELCSRLRAFEAGGGGNTAADSLSSPSSEFTGMLQLLKATLQATELFMGRHQDLAKLVHQLIVMQAMPDDEGSPVSLLESLIKTLCSGAAISTAHAYKVAFILRICVARHTDWRLSEELFDTHCLLGIVSSVLEDALRQKQAVLAQRMLCPVAWPDQEQPHGASQAETTAAVPMRVKIVGPLVNAFQPLISGRVWDSCGAAKAGQQLSAEEPAEVARRSAKAYLESVRAGMGADRAPAVAGVARAIIQQEESLCAPRKNGLPLAQQGELVRLREVLDEFMPAPTGFGIPINYDRKDNICKGAAMDDGLVPQEYAADSFLDSKGTPPTDRAQSHGSATGINSKAAKDQGWQHTGGGDSSLQATKSLNAELKKKLAELEKLKRLKAEQSRLSQKGSAVPENSCAGDGPIPFSIEYDAAGSHAAESSAAQAGRIDPAKQPNRFSAMVSGPLDEKSAHSCTAATKAAAVSKKGGLEHSAHHRKDCAGENTTPRGPAMLARNRAAGNDTSTLQHPLMSSAAPVSSNPGTQPEHAPAIRGGQEQPCNAHDVPKEGSPATGHPVPSNKPTWTRSNAKDPVAQEEPDCAAETPGHKQAKTSHCNQDLSAKSRKQPTIAEEAAAIQAHLQGRSASPDADQGMDGEPTNRDFATQKVEEIHDVQQTQACRADAQSHETREQQLQGVHEQQRKQLESFHSSRGRAEMEVDPPAVPLIRPPPEPPAAEVGQQQQEAGQQQQEASPLVVTPMGPPSAGMRQQRQEVSPPGGPPTDPLAAAVVQQQDEEMPAADEDESMEDATWEVLQDTSAKTLLESSKPSYASITAGSTAAQGSGSTGGSQVPLVRMHAAGGNPYGPHMRAAVQAISDRGGGGTQQSIRRPSATVSTERRPPPGMDWVTFNAGSPLSSYQMQSTAPLQPSYRPIAAQKQDGTVRAKGSGGRAAGDGMDHIGMVDYRKK